MDRLKRASKDVHEILNSLIKKEFKHLKGFKFLLLFDTKLKLIAQVHIYSKPLIWYLKESNLQYNNEHFIIIIDRLLWQNIDQKDKIRILRHELNHCNRLNSTKIPCIKHHDFAGFYSDILDNLDDSKWQLRLSNKMRKLYDG